MAEKKTFKKKDMVGTPRGYVKKADVERVDREMTPILKGATTALSFMPIVGPGARAGMMAYRGSKAAKAAASVASKAKKGGDASRRFSPAGAKKAAKEAPKSDATNKVLAGLGGVTAAGYAASKFRSSKDKGGGPEARQGSSSPSIKPRKMNIIKPDKNVEPKKSEAASTKSMEKAYQAIGTRTGTDAPVRAVRRAIPIPQPKPDRPKKADKSSGRVAFEKEFAKNRKAGKKSFDFRGKKYSTKLK